MAQRYEVLRDGARVLEFTAEPGTLSSSALGAPGQQPVTHPFLNAHALDARREDELGRLARAATSVEGFIAALKAAGYQVAPRPS